MEASKAIDDNTALFYQQKVKEGYDMLDNTLALLINTNNVILETRIGSKEKDINQEVLNIVLSNAMIAIENGDTILLSDILYFDLKPLLERICK